jgi:hypothetical protein
MDETSSTNAGTNWNLPISLLAVSLALFIFAEAWSGGAESRGIEFQDTALSEAKTRLTELIDKNTKELEERKPMVATSENIQQQFKDDFEKVKKMSTSSAQFEALHKQIADMNKALLDRKPQVEQSEEVQKQFSQLINDLDVMSKGGDKDATDLIKIAANVYGLRINANDATTTTPVPRTDDKKPEDPKPDDKKPEDKKPEDKKPEEKKPEEKKKP